MNSIADIHRQRKPKTIFPLIRHFSYPVTFLLLRTKLTPNQVTSISIPIGLAAAICLLPGRYELNVLAGVFLILNYIFDNCDGEVARAKQLGSPFGEKLDTFADWLVSSLLFAAMGHGIYAGTHQSIWIWFGWAAALGGTINYAFSLYMGWQHRRETDPSPSVDPEAEPMPDGKPKVINTLSVALREFSRADFCFILLAVALLDGLQYLLPLAAIGAQAYWIMFFAVRGEDHHV